MEASLKSKYSTKELKVNILENRKLIDENKDCSAAFSTHIQEHTILLDPMLKNHEVILFGEKGDNGMVLQSKEIAKGFNTLRNLGYGLISAIIIDLVFRVMSLPR